MTEKGLRLTRVLDAPRALVWKLWTDAHHLAKWWGPAGFTMKVAALDLRAGGLFHYAMTPPDSDAPMWGRFVYDEVVACERLVFRSAFSDPSAGVGVNPFLPSFPLEIKTVLTFEDQGTKTLLTLRGEPWRASDEQAKAFADQSANVAQGFAGTFAQLEAHLADALEAGRALVCHRRFAAPRAVVWSAWTTASKIAAWWGPAGFANTVESMDVRPGGQWVFTMHGPDGTDYPNKVTYLEVQEPSRLVYDHGDPGRPNHFRVTVTFTEAGGQTDLSYKMVFDTEADLKQAVETYGAREGLKQNLDRFAVWLSKPGLVLTRVVAAPRALVWKAFVDPSQLLKWWGPEGFTCPDAKVEAKVGGRYLLGMRAPDGRESWRTGTFKEVILNQKLVYTDHLADAGGRIITAASLGLPGEGTAEPITTVTFWELGKAKTRLAVHQEFLPDELHDATRAAWFTSFDKLARHLNA